jgi:hypothetical protein
MTVFLLFNVDAGIGHHIWDLSYQQVMGIGKWSMLHYGLICREVDKYSAYITTLFWAVELLLLKYSILCLYLRIFPNLWLKRAVIAFTAFTTLFTFPLIGLAAFQCVPVRAIWDLELQKTATCIDWIAVLRATVVYEVIAETVLFALPIPIVLKLKLKSTKKVQLIVFFGLGIGYV